jgi:6-phosphofructokinase 2
VVASGSLPPGVPDDFFARVARVARKLGARCVVDTSGEPLKHAVAEGVFLVKPNASELCQLVGRALRDEKEQSSAALELAQSKKSELVVISRGAAGALLATAEGTERFWAPSVHVKSRVGAGDSMLAGIVLGLLRGMIPSAAVRYGIAAGAAATMRSGTELCHREDVEHLHAQMV